MQGMLVVATSGRKYLLAGKTVRAYIREVVARPGLK
jgi:hypothetical protein